ncbi:MAG: trypsin-like peptidase domain-containing protein [Planctomycetes bacterium]|nr:trypsin-like peptidase domain-containing protein [Planctomycetota bacterium]
MTRIFTYTCKFALACCVIGIAATNVAAQAPVTGVVGDVNKRMVKLFGIGGFKNLPSYGSGILVSAKGHILTVNNHILNTPGILVHLYDGRQYQAKVLVREPELDVALLKIDEEINFLPHFTFEGAATKPLAENGDWILAFSNQFKIALRDEPMSVQRGVIMSVADLRGRRGVFDAPYAGEAYFLDVIACNPGAAGGVLTNRKGELLGVLGRELKSTSTNTWVNYAVPIQATVEVQRLDVKAGKTVTNKESIVTFVQKALVGKYEATVKAKREDKGAYHGITLVVNAVSSTPPYVEELAQGSPAALAGLQPDDLILYVDGESVPTIKNFREAIKAYEPGREVTIQFQRGNQLISAKMKLTAQPKAPVSK